MNDGGKNQKDKDKLLQQFLGFLNVKAESPRRQRRGLYSAHLFPWPQQQQQQQQQQQAEQQQQQQQTEQQLEQQEGVRLLLLDTRMHRDLHALPSPAMYFLHSPLSPLLSLAGAASRFLVHLLGYSKP